MKGGARSTASRRQIALTDFGVSRTVGQGSLIGPRYLYPRRADFQRARRFLVSFQVEDDQHRVMDAVRDLQVDIKDAAGLEKLLLRLNIALNSKE